MGYAARTLSVMAAGLLVVGCDQALDPAEVAAQEANRTIVALGSGAPQVQVLTVSQEQRQAELQQRQALVVGSSAGNWYDIINDGSCAGSSMWIFDGAALTGKEICFYGTGNQIDGGSGTSSTLLSLYCRTVHCGPGHCFCALTWDSAVGSYWAGYNPGWFVTNNGNSVFSPYQQAASGVAGASALALSF